MSADLHTVHVRVNDAATGQPTPVRLRITDSDGKYYAPFGRLTEFAIGREEDVGGNLLLGSKKYAYIDGTCEIALPPGRIDVELHKGPEYTPQLFEDKLGKGQLTLRYAMERWANLRNDRWYSGDMRAHALTPHGALLEAAAEDLAVVNLLIDASILRHTNEAEYQLRELFEKPPVEFPRYQVLSNILAFSGQRPALEMPGHLVVVNSSHYHAIMGFLSLLNCHRFIYPLRVDADEGLTRWTLADWCDQCHRKGGLVVWDGSSTRVAINLPYGEGLADLLLGKIDAIEAAEALEECVAEEWYPFLDCGCHVPLVGSSGKHSNRELLGEKRTYARLQEGQEFNYQNWVEAVRAGRTFVTYGPLVNFRVNGQDPGTVIKLAAPGQPVQILAEARSAAPFDQLELVLNGEVLANATASGSPAMAAMNFEMTLPAVGWLAVRCRSSPEAPGCHGKAPITAHTSPIYVQVEGQPSPIRPAAVAELLACLEAWIAQIAQRIDPGNGHATHRLLKIFESARQVLRERLQA